MNLVSLSQVCRIVNGGTPKSGVKEYWGGDVSWLTPAEMGKLDAPEIAATARTITDAGLKNSSAKQVPVGSVIMSTRAPIGHLAIPRAPMAFNQGCRGLVPNDRLDTKYLYYFLLFSREALNDLGTGTTFKELSAGALGSCKIPLPPLEEQRRIVAVLDEAFAAIATAAANVEKKIANVEDLFEAFASSLFNSGGAGWKAFSLGEVCDLFQGLAINRGTKHLIVPDGLPLLRIKDLRDGSHEMCVAPAGFPKNALVNPSDLIYTRTGQVGLVFRGRSGIIHNNCFKIASRDGLDNDYLFWWLQQKSFREKITRLASRAAQPDITHSIFKTMPISIPPMAYQRRAVCRIDKFQNHVQKVKLNYREKHDRLGDLRMSLLASAFEGTLLKARQPLAA